MRKLQILSAIAFLFVLGLTSSCSQNDTYSEVEETIDQSFDPNEQDSHDGEDM